MRWLYGGMAVAVLAVLAGVILALSAPTQGARGYAQGTPEEALESLWEMIEAHEAERISEFLYADTQEMRSAWEALGGLLGRCEELASAIAQRFPEDVAAIREDPSPLIDIARALTRGQGGQGGRRGSADAAASAARDGRGPRDRRDSDVDGLARVLTDPFGWVACVKGRVAAEPVGDEMAAITVDGKPALGVGLMMRPQEGRWRVVAPLNLPVASKWAPRNAEEWSIVASLIVVIDNTIAELTEDVRAGKAKTLDDCAELAGEKALGPAVICFYAYNRAVEAREEQ
jgi:hypothetical protein